MIRLVSKAPFPLPIQTGKMEIIKRTRVTRRKDGTSGTRPENVRSVETVVLNPGKGAAITVPDHWRNLPDIKSYKRRRWILIYDVPAETTPDAEKPVAAKKARKRKTNG